MNSYFPFKNHPQFSILVDILSRKDQHHIILNLNFSTKWHQLFINAFLHYLRAEPIPFSLRNAEIVHLDINKAKEGLDRINDPAFRLILTNNATSPISSLTFSDQFIVVTIPALSDADVTAIMKQERSKLEEYHHILIPEELLQQAYALAERYLNPELALDHALRLLDSSAARTQPNDLQPALSCATLIQVLSGWVGIPNQLLSFHPIKLFEFIKGMQQKIIGQDTAINHVGQALMQAQLKMRAHNRPYCSLLFAGENHSGKKTTAIAMATQLFNQKQALYFAQFTKKSLASIAEMKFFNYQDQHLATLKEVISAIPYAIIYFAEIEKADPLILHGLHEIVTTGYLEDDDHKRYSFQQATIIISTTVGSHCIVEASKTMFAHHENHEMDLMQLVLGEQQNDAPYLPHQNTAYDLADDIFAEITSHLPTELCQHFQIVPFFPLNKTSMEQLANFKLQTFCHDLAARYAIQLSIAPEVIHYLINYKNRMQHALKQLYFLVEQTIATEAPYKRHPQQLFLQLNETGQLLRCEWIAQAAMRHQAS